MLFLIKNCNCQKNINSIPHDAIAGEKFDLITNTPNILSRKTNKNPNETPIARLDPVPPLLLIDDTERAIMVRIKQEKGIVYLLCLTNK